MRPFYAPFSGVAQASDVKLRSDIQEEFGGDLGRCVADSVEVVEIGPWTRDLALAAFGNALSSAFPTLDTSTKTARQMFEALSTLVQQKRGTPLRRAELVHVIEQHLGYPLFPTKALPLHVRSDRNGADERAFEIDASEFAGGSLPFPPTPRWSQQLLNPLDVTARWLHSHGINRVALSGSYRITTALALGWSLRSATGFEVEMLTREGVWATDDRPRAEETYSQWHIVDASTLDADCLHLSVGVLRNPAPALHALGVSSDTTLSATLSTPITSARAVQAGVSLIKEAVSATVARLRPSRITLYFAGPVVLAVALGHRWNSLPATQLHEFDPSRNTYLKTALLIGGSYGNSSTL